jgi:hypothetical protein
MAKPDLHDHRQVRWFLQMNKNAVAQFFFSIFSVWFLMSDMPVYFGIACLTKFDSFDLV